jgi:hypothetical protein
MAMTASRVNTRKRVARRPETMRGYISSMLTLSIFTLGAREFIGSRGGIAISTSMPPITCPKTLCLPSKCGVGTCVMKNCEPFVRDRIGHQGSGVCGLGGIRQRVAGPAASPGGIAALGHEIRDDAMEHAAVIETFASEEYKVVHCIRSLVCEKLENDIALLGVQSSRIPLFLVNRQCRGGGVLLHVTH